MARFSKRRSVTLCRHVLRMWEDNRAEERARLSMLERRVASAAGRRLRLRAALCDWCCGVRISREERFMEEKVALKWRQVREWLK